MSDSDSFEKKNRNIEGDIEQIPSAEFVDDVYVFPTSFAQKRLWFLDQFDEGSPFYNIPTAVRLKGQFNVDIFKACIQEIVERHETLRTIFAIQDNEPVQVIYPELAISIPTIDLTTLPEVYRESQALRLANEEARKPFDLKHGPLIRVTVLKLGKEDHIVLLTMHHIVSDGWSMGVLVAEISTLYAAFSQNRPSPLAELPIQYADFAEWQQSWLTGDVLEQQLEYWKNIFNDGIPILELPTDRPRPAIFSSLGGAISGVIPKDLTEQIRNLSRKESATIFMILLAGLNLLLHRYSKQDVITIGSPMANRTRAEVEGLIGVFINTLVFKNDMSGNPTFKEFLSRVRETSLGAFAHQDLPFESLVEELQVERDMSRTPLFQVMLILQNAPTGGQQPTGLSMEAIDIHMGTSTFDLTFSIAETVEGLDVSIEYNSDIFDESTITRMFNHYRTLLESVVTEPTLAINEVPILTEDEYQELIYTFNDTFSERQWNADRRYLPVHKLFELSVKRNPDATAIVVPADESQSRVDITYGELDKRADKLANRIMQYRIKPETVIGIYTERSIEMYIAILGVLKAGGAYLPLDPVHPQDRLEYILSDSCASFIVCQKELLDRLPETKSEIIILEDELIEGDKLKVSDRTSPNVSPEAMVYMTYTSGSTGQSKGVIVTHANLVNAYLGWEEAYDLYQIRSHLQMANFTFDVFSGDLVRSLLSGSKLVICPREWLLDPKKLYRLIIEEQIECAEFVPAVLRHLVDFIDDNNLSLDSMRVLACGSDSWYVGEYRKFTRVLGKDTRLINSFGLTETTIDSTYFEGSMERLSDDQMVPIGRPFINTQLYILDEYLQPTPIGIPGELYIGGLGVSRGYHNRSTLTAEKFIPNPFGLNIDFTSDNLGIMNRLYRTGDMARYRLDGNIEFLGRIDEQLKLRGYRIEPGEIESVLGSHPQVKDAAVLAVEIKPGDKRLVAYIEKEGLQEPTSSSLRRHVQDRLPDYMVPSAFIILERMPLNASGKIDRRLLGELPPPDLSIRELGEEYVAPTTPVQIKLSEIWGQILGLKPIDTGNGDGKLPAVGIYDNFFELGGHSLLATQLISRVREAFKIDIALRYIFDSPTISAFAEQVEIALTGEKKHEAPPLVGIERDPVTGLPIEAPPLSFAQQRLWFLDQLEPGSPYYNLPDAVRIKGELYVKVLEKSINEVVRRHEALRTVFRVVNDVPVQIIVPEYEIAEGNSFYIHLVIDDLRNLPEAQREHRALEIAQLEAQQPFDLEKGPLLRARLLRIRGDLEDIRSGDSKSPDNGNGRHAEGETPEFVVLLTMHHIIGDNWSSNILTQELAILYDVFSKGLPSPIPPMPIQYSDFSSWQRNWLRGEILENEIKHWKNKLQGLPPLLELPTDRQRPAVQTFNGDYFTFTLSGTLSRQIRKMSQDEGVTIFMLLLSAFQVLLSRYSGQEDIAVGTPIANRNRTEIENLIGFFVNTLVIRGNLTNQETFREFLEQIREFSLDAYAHQDVPFEMIVDALQPERNLSHSPIFQVMFALQSSQMMTQTLPSSGLMLSPVDAHSGTSKFDLTLFMIEEEGISKEGAQYFISGAMEYNTDLFDKSTIERMTHNYKNLLENITRYPDQIVSLLDILDDTDKNQLIVDWNQTTLELPQNFNVVSLFENQVERVPDKPAVQIEKTRGEVKQNLNTSITYSELNERANILAHYLISVGVKPDTLIGIYAERSIDLVIGLLGILKSGAAYLPFDASYPQERITFMLNDAAVSIVLTQEGLRSSLPAEHLNDVQNRTIPLDSFWQTLEELSDQNPGWKQNPNFVVQDDNLAYVIYTSGSTGKPKGAMIIHRGLSNYLNWVLSAYPIDQGKGAPVHSSISFDLTVTGVFGPLVSGRTVNLFPEGIGVESLGESLIKDFEEKSEPYSLIKITPAHLQILGDQLFPEAIPGRTHAFIIGGENLTSDQIKDWREYAPDTALVNEYGPTETVVGCCVYWVPRADQPQPETSQSGVIPIGRPITNTNLYILDEQFQPVPIGVVGELYIGGAGISRGYLSRAELTAERFIPNPFTAIMIDSGMIIPIDNRLYKTGDLARYLPDGNIECLGRVDFQVKIRGFRVELGEIESVLNQYEQVKESVAWIREDAGSKRLVAYIVTENSEKDLVRGKGDFINNLRIYLQERLPDYMVPSAFALLNEIPLTPNGKVDRKALPAPELIRIDQTSEAIPPRNPQEEILSSIWEEVLGLELTEEHPFISIHDNFFELGGHSLLATQVISRMRDAFNVEVPLRTIFEAPTIAGMAQQIERVRQAAFGIVTPPIERIERDPETGRLISPPPLSFGQQRLWFLEQLEPGKPYYNTPAAVRISGALDINALEKSIQEIIKRHESLRTKFIDVDGKPFQVIGSDVDFKVKVVDLAAEEGDDQEKTVQKLIADDSLIPFDLSMIPLLRATLFVLRQDEFIILLNMHHIISDDWSLGVLIQEIATIYSALSSIDIDHDDIIRLLPELPVQYADYAAWQRNWLQGEVLDNQISYWVNQLAGAPPILDLPIDKPRPPVQTFWGAQKTFDINPDLAAKLMNLGRRSGTTLFMTLLASFQLLLSRLTNQEDISIGTPIANRTRAEIEGLIGFFVNTLVMRTKLSGDPTFMELLQRVRDVTLDAYAHQDVPFEMLVDSIQPERDMSHSPLFQAMLVVQNAPRERVDITSDLRMMPLETHDRVARFDITLSFTESPGGISGAFEYNTDLFYGQTVDRMISYFLNLLDYVTRNPETRVSGIELLTELEKNQILYSWNDTYTQRDVNRPVHKLFEDQVDRNPLAIAIKHIDSELSYGELNSRANKLAWFLIKNGIQLEDLVGISITRSIDMIVAMLGVLKAGAAFVPIDPNYPDDRINYMIHDSGLSILLTSGLQDEFFADRITSGIRVIKLDEDWERINTYQSENPFVFVDGENLAYVIYTSGSTGRPKGVALKHSGLNNLNYNQTQKWEVNAHSRVLQFASISFDASLSEIFNALCYGATLVLPIKEVVTSIPELIQFLIDERITTATFPPSLLKEFPEEKLPDLQYLSTAGEKCPIEVAKRWSTGRHFYNAYGPTETTIGPTMYEIKQLNPDSTAVPIGRPLENIQVFILNNNLNPVPVGVVGEIYIGGIGLARGYLGKPGMTAEKFIPNPYLPSIKNYHPGAEIRMYRTGDLGKYNPDGLIEYAGRIDQQVKVRGFRIELGEIENTLMQHIGVENAVVIAREDTPGYPRLVGYIKPVEESMPAISVLRQFLADSLPDYMVPSIFVEIDEIPVTPSGKVDKNSLPVPEISRSDLETTYIAPRNSTEELLTTIWGSLLGIEAEKIGVYDNFFELGGHSLIATQIMSRINKEFQTTIPLRDLFESPNISELAEVVDIARNKANIGFAPPIVKLLRDENTGLPIELPPLSFAQQRLWFLYQLEPDVPFYNIPGAFRLHGDLDLGAFERSINELIQRHEILRTQFITSEEGQGYQLINPTYHLEVPVFDLTSLEDPQREQKLLELAQVEANKPFNLEVLPLIRVTLLKLTDEDHVILLNMHHIISDGWSMNIIAREIVLMYDALVNNTFNSLPELPIQYADFSAWQRDWLKDEVIKNQIDYWKNQLAEAPPLLELPTDYPRPPVQTYNGKTLSFEFSAELSKAIKRLSQFEGTTLYMTLLAAFQTLLARYSGQMDISVGTPIANRTRPELEDLIGFFVNTLVMRLKIDGAPDFHELIKRTREVTLGAYAHQDIPFEMLVDEIGAERNISHSPLFQVVFTLQSASGASGESRNLKIQSVEAETGIAKYDLTMTIVDGIDQFHGTIEFNTDLFVESTIQRMIEHFKVLVNELVTHPEKPVTTINLLTKTEEEQIIYTWNDTRTEDPYDYLAHHLFEKQVNDHPESIAVDFEGQLLSYQELNRRSNKLAHYLISRGVGPDTLVGLCCERSLDMIIGLMGILKAGGAYLPLDPSNPAERISYMLTDSQTGLVLSQSPVLEKHEFQDIDVFLLDRDASIIDDFPNSNPINSAVPDNRAYVIYTSGSTGRPKGVDLHHRGLCNLALAYINKYKLGPGDNILQFFSLSFDGSVADIFSALLSGATIALPKRETVVSMIDLHRFMQNHEITFFVMTPSALAVLPSHELPSLKYVITGGEACTPEVIHRWFSNFRNLVNVYGPTEATVVSTWYWIDENIKPELSIPIGNPLPNYQNYIIDESLMHVPIGIVGELLIGGIGLARGYLNRPGLTAEKFVPDPFGKQPGARVYRTGDLARYSVKGDIEYLGRIDNQVKVRGFRIELGEIENRLSNHPGINSAVVTVREDSPGFKRLVAYLVHETGELDESELKEYLSKDLPDYMIPVAFITLDEFPLNTSGKVDRKLLPVPEISRDRNESEFILPRTESEMILAGVWKKILGLEQVGIHDNFFELGGDSIVAIQMIAKAKQAGISISPKLLFQNPTIEGMLKSAGSGEDINAEQGIVMGHFPLTPIQKWLFDNIEINPEHWNTSMFLELSQPLDREILSRTVLELMMHHDALRLRFEKTSVGYQQVNAGDEVKVPFDYFDYSHISNRSIHKEIESSASNLQSSLNLEKGPLFRVAYFHLGGERPARLLFVFHHLVMDGVSWRIFLEDFQVVYGQLMQGIEPQLPPKTTSYKYWSEKLYEYAQSVDLRNEFDYWLKLATVEHSKIPVDNYSGANTFGSSEQITLSLTHKETQSLIHKVTTAYNAGINDVLLAALVRTFRKYTGSNQLMIEMEGHGREDIFSDVDVSRTIGWFTITYPVFLELKKTQGFTEEINAIRQQMSQIPNNGIGYGMLSELCEDPEITPLTKTIPQPEINFNYLGQFDQMPETEWVPFRIAKESVGPEQSPEAKRPALLYVVGIVSGGIMHWRWLYSREIHKRKTIKEFADNFLAEIRELIASVDPEDVSTPYDRLLESPLIQRFRGRKPESQ